MSQVKVKTFLRFSKPKEGEAWCGEGLGTLEAFSVLESAELLEGGLNPKVALGAAQFLVDAVVRVDQSQYTARGLAHLGLRRCGAGQCCVLQPQGGDHGAAPLDKDLVDGGVTFRTPPSALIRCCQFRAVHHMTRDLSFYFYYNDSV